MNNTKLINLFKNKIALILTVIFIITRLYIAFGFNSQSSDILIYANYAYESLAAKENKKNLYDFHEEIIQYQIDYNKAHNQNYSESDKIIEYPPLAIKFIELPNLFYKFNPQIPQEQIFNDFIHKYTFRYKLFNLLLEIVCFILILSLLLNIYDNKNNIELSLRILFVTISGVTLLNILYDRLDITLGVLIAVSLFFLLSRKNYILSYIFLCLAIHFKLVPLLLLPVWIIATLPDNFFQMLFDREKMFQAIVLIIKRIGVMTGLISVTAALFWILYGGKCFNFLSFHSERGLQIESIYSSLMLLIDFFYKINIRVTQGFGGFNLDSNIANIILSASTPMVVMSFILLIVFFIFIVIKIKKTKFISKNDSQDKTLAQSAPEIFVVFTILFLSIPLTFSKVFSPQYLLWFIPMMMLFPLNNIYLKISPWLFIIVCIITTIIFPYKYFSDIAVFGSTPTFLGNILLISRNLLFILFNIFLILGILQIQKDNKILPVDKSAKESN
jgi:hypothetical protein